MLKNDVIWPDHRQFDSKTEWEPVGFFSECLCNATSFDLMLGFFSSSAIEVLADGFALFLYHGGSMRLIINDVLTEQDRGFIVKGKERSVIDYFDTENLEQMKATLSKRNQHFFDCLSFLIQEGRIDIKVVRPRNSIGISHSKLGIFSDAYNAIGFNGSCNFSRQALIENIESITIDCDWDGQVAKSRVRHNSLIFDKAFSGESPNYEYLDAAIIRNNIQHCFHKKPIDALLEQEEQIILKDRKVYPINNNVAYALKRTRDKVNSVLSLIKEKCTPATSSDNPAFPYPTGPRDYQEKAFENWVSNKQKGLFAMATGTGKTITSLNCLLHIFQGKAGFYKAIILVPTTVLVDQWAKECKKFHFDNIIKVYSKNNAWKKALDNIILQEKIDDENKVNYVIISTYASFARDNVFAILTQLPRKKVLLVADECHNIGAGKIKVRLPFIPYIRRIGLSATPQRQFDDEGNRAIRDFFGIQRDYTFVYTMKQAISEGKLCQYYYYPHVVSLNTEEMKEYNDLSVKLAQMYMIDNERFKNEEMLTALLLKRKRIIHKAEGKKDIFRQILKKRIETNGTLKYTLVYVPEGNEPSEYTDNDYDCRDTISDDEETNHLIDEYTRLVAEANAHTTVMQFTGETPNRDEILEKFAKGELDVLTSMKCLDEGVDVPRSEMAIFCASTGNPRQFIQRRGRILRTHKDKRFAIIHDLVVVPRIDYSSPSFKMERNLLNNEMKRVREFANLSENSSDTLKELEDILTYYQLPTF